MRKYWRYFSGYWRGLQLVTGLFYTLCYNHMDSLYPVCKNEEGTIIHAMDLTIEATPTAKRNLVITFLVNHPKALVLLWTARKRAQEIGGVWRVVYIGTPDQQKTAHSASHEQILHLLTRAKQMGGETEHIEALSLLKGAEDVLKKETGNINSVIIGSTEHEGLFSRLRTPQWVRLVELASRYAKVESVPLAGQFRQPFYGRVLGRIREIEPKHIVFALLGMLVPSLIVAFMQSVLQPAFFRINEQNIDNLFLIAVAVIAGRYGLVPGVIAAIAGFLIENYYFTLPYHAFKLQSVTDLFSMGLFLSAATIIAIFTSQMRGYAQKIRKRELHTDMLFTLYRLTSESFTRKQAIETLQKNLEQMLKADVVFFLPHALGNNELEAVSGDTPALSDNDRRALIACWTDMKCTGAASPYNPGTAWRFEPMMAASGEVGVLGVRVRDVTQLDAWFGRLLTATADQTAAILSHIELERSMEATRISEEREKLRVMLLSSVSHDLKTPLAGIIGALSACQTLGARLKPAQQKELIEGSLEEAQRLDSFITNIMDMTRLETGNIKFSKDWHNIRELTEHVVKRLSHRLKQREVRLRFPTQNVEARMDNIMTGQVLQNLIDNVCKYTPQGTPIEVSWQTDDKQELICRVRDFGGGIPSEKLIDIFDKYTRLQRQDTQTPGTGLGLAISRSIMEAQGGWIKADNHPEGGAVFTFCLPHWRSVTDVAAKEKLYATLG